MALAFAKEHGIKWPTTYGLSLETMNSLGVLNPDLSIAAEVTPTIYLLDADGVVLWSDNGYRTTHPDVSLMLDDLRIFIELALLPIPVGKS